jgi:beta-lactamase superfamily II metal-dependent hydrolase
LRFFLLLCLVVIPLEAQSLEIHFLDVGQGDAVLLREGGKAALIDAGPSGANVLAHLRARGVDTLDLLVASHNHTDHIGGMTAVLGATVVRFYMDNGMPSNTATYQRTIAAVQRSGAQYLNATPRTVSLGAAQLRVLTPLPRARRQNLASVGIRVDYGGFHALLTGDSETELLTHWLTTGEVARVQVLKAAHHGSANGVTPGWVTTTSPGVVVISVGSTNGYGHPSAFAIGLWERAGAHVYRTDRDGAITIQARQNGTFEVGRRVTPLTNGRPKSR